MSDKIEINGKHTDATIFTEDVDDACIGQVQQLVNHEAFQNPVKVMPDAHAGSGAVIGFTMELGERVVPNTVGVDIGCGMTAFNLGTNAADEIENNPQDVDERIRDSIPLGYKTFGDIPRNQKYHIVNDFPWDDCHFKARSLNEQLDNIKVDESFGESYFKDLCDRVEYDPKRAIDSLGTLGGGNHFIEISQSDATGEYWVVIHSGSRGIGLSIAQYWQERAHENCDERARGVRRHLSYVPDWAYKFDLDEVSDFELLNWIQGGMGEDWKRTDEIAERYDGDDIGTLIDELNDLARYVAENGDGNDLDYLNGEYRSGYLKDMIFAQTYAAESRRKMCQDVADTLHVTVEDEIVSTHNYIDFDDLIIRKGATRVHEGERGIIPFNMRDGAVIVRGLGNDKWHSSAPHGAGRRGSRRWAYDTFDVSQFVTEMGDVFSTSVNEDTLDEAPMAYKNHETILDIIDGTTVNVEETLVPKINIKAES